MANRYYFGVSGRGCDESSKRCACGAETRTSQTVSADCSEEPCWWCDTDTKASELVAVTHKGRTIRVCGGCASEVQMRRAS